jgi:hypothetical protein
MSVSKRFVPMCLTGLFVAGIGQAAYAGPQSLLDPYASVSAPSKLYDPNEKKPRKLGLPSMRKGAAKPKAQPTQAAQAETETTFVTNPGGGKGKQQAKAVASKPVETTTQVTETATPAPKTASAKDAKGGMLDGIKNATKSSTGAVVNGTKKMGSGIANGAKASGEVFVKGANFVGSGFKATGSAIKEGTSGVAEKVANVNVPNPLKRNKKGSLTKQTSQIASKQEIGKPQSAQQTGSNALENSQNDLTAAGSDLTNGETINQTQLSEAKPKKEGKGALAGLSQMGGNMTKSISKLNPFNFGKKNASPADAAGQEQPIAGKEVKPTL